MAQLVTAGNLFYKGYSGNAVLTNVALPAGVSATAARPSFATMRRGTVVAGQWDRGLYWQDQHELLRRLGIAAPTGAPTIAANGVGLTASVIGYVSFVEKFTSGPTTYVIHQSNLSPASATLVLVNQGVRWTNLPAVSPDARTTHIRLWRSVDGSLPKMVTDLPLGTLTHDEATAFDALGEFPPVFSDGTLNPQARGVPPYCLFAIRYHDRILYAGDPANPQRVWISLIGEPESVAPLSYMDTRDMEAVTGLGISGDQVIVGCHEALYDLQGYSQGPSADFNMRKVSDSVGCISHHSMININGRLYWAGIDGVYRWVGQPQYLMKKMRTYWKEQYAVDRINYERCIAIDDRDYHCYRLLIPGQAGAFYYVAHYLALDQGEDQPWWAVDRRNRGDFALGELFNVSTGRTEYCVGGADGYVRKENVASDASDDGDSYNKRVIVRPKHFYMGDQSGPLSHGKTVRDLTLYQKTENQGYTVAIYGGDDPARDAGSPTWGPHSFPAEAIVGSVAETSKYLRPTMASGKGFTLEVVVDSPVDYEWRGFSASLTTGPQSRGKT